MSASYGITSTEVGYAYPDIQVATGAAVTPDSLEYLIGLATAELNGILDRVGVDADTIAADSATDEYANCQRLVLDLLGPRLQAAAHGQIATADELARIQVVVADELRQLRRQPQELGTVPDTTEPRVVTSTSALGLDTDDTSRRSRRFFGGSARRDGADQIWRD